MVTVTAFIALFFILGSFKSLPTSVISSLIQLNVQAGGSRQYLIPEEREERIKETQQCLALNFKKIQSPNFLDKESQHLFKGQLFTFIEDFR